jgi:hypothetical protein
VRTVRAWLRRGGGHGSHEGERERERERERRSLGQGREVRFGRLL